MYSQNRGRPVDSASSVFLEFTTNVLGRAGKGPLSWHQDSNEQSIRHQTPPPSSVITHSFSLRCLSHLTTSLASPQAIERIPPPHKPAAGSSPPQLGVPIGQPEIPAGGVGRGWNPCLGPGLVRANQRRRLGGLVMWGVVTTATGFYRTEPLQLEKMDERADRLDE
jgi:hypothetical protein